MAAIQELLREHGPAGPAFWRFGREDRQNLGDAIGNPRRDAALARRAENGRRRQAQEAAEREAQRPVRGNCGQKFTDDRWKAGIAVDWGCRDSHPHLLREWPTPGLVLPGLRSWARSVRDDLASEGIWTGPLSIGCQVGPGPGDGDPDALAERWYRLAQARDTFETTVGF
ncbi:hypothetical protein JIX56_00860 [Streptomyces sp. CA-210063]|uniref:hypothetical protein n=1 Tax=Streptomyces sp. CA-210063 TaxID=2801029 RepID=UPI00214AD413|nr:hypothetical protein [Streptomyces sp. CA-210063]UUU28567.1 hypothetical protein JIX56_00860 [Streptomyces sp. CA-210063]